MQKQPSIDVQGGLYYWSYIFYLSKYYELLDTLLIVLKVHRLGQMQSYSNKRE
jgi:hypothetical protein